MSYPDEADPSVWPITEWLIDGTWVDLSNRVRGEIGIRRGRQNEQGTISPGTAEYNLNNFDGAISNRNPLSPYYRKIPTGIQVRNRAGNGDNHAFLQYNDLNVIPSTSITTADKASLDITGDMELRMDIEPHTWRPTGHSMILMSKYAQGSDQRSWVLYLHPTGKLAFSWSPDGGALSRVFALTNVSVPATSGRISIRMTFDVNNGAGGTTVTYYTGPSINGPWTQLGAPAINAGLVGIKSSTAAVIIGAGEDVPFILAGGVTYGGKVFAAHIYNGIGGTRVASPDFGTWGLGDTSKVDAEGNTWTMSGQARMTSQRIRFWGELASTTQSTDASGNDKLVPILAADPTQSLSNVKVPPDSPLYLQISRKKGLLGYWPMEDGEDADLIGNAVGGGQQGKIRGSAYKFGSDSSLLGSNGAIQLDEQLTDIKLPAKRGTGTTSWNAVWAFRMPGTLPASASTVFSINAAGTMRNIAVLIDAGGFTLRIAGADFFTPILNQNVSFGSGVLVSGEWLVMRLKFTRFSSTLVDYEWAWYKQQSNVFYGYGGTINATSVGYPIQFYASPQANSTFNGMKVAHVALAEQDLGFATTDPSWQRAIDAYAGERAAERIQRVAAANGLYCEILGDTLATPQMGPQASDTPMNVFRDAAQADGGLLFGLRDQYGLCYRTRRDLEKRGDAALTYGAHLAEPPRVIDDIESIVNTFTATRKGGSSATAEITTGFKSTQAPPLGAGYRPGGEDFNLFDDSTLTNLANLRARYSTVDAPRVPDLTIEYHRDATHPSTAAGAAGLSLDLGDTAYVTAWPQQMAPRTLSFVTQGYDERLEHSLWTTRYNTSPAQVLRTGQYDTPSQVAGPTRYGSSGSSLTAGITASATSLQVTGAAVIVTPETWTTNAARYPLDVMINGEQITLNTPPTGSTSPQTFNGVTRAVNGVARAHLAGSKVQLAIITHYGLKA